MISKKPEIIDGIECYCTNVDGDHEDYPEAGLEGLYSTEKDHFWFLSRCEYIVDAFKKYVNKKDNIIEIGAGTGNVSRALMSEGYSPAVGELHLSGLRYAKSYGIDKCYQFDLYDSPFKNKFDVVGMFDVLEHLSDTEKALNQIHSMLRGDGKLIITVPAHMWLWNSTDDAAGHKIRYTRQTLMDVFESSGFEVIKIRYFFIMITPLLWIRALFDSRGGVIKDEIMKSSSASINPVLNKILLFICRIENRFNSILPNWFGGSLLAVVKKT